MAHNFQSISTSVVKAVRITPLGNIEGISTLRKAWRSVEYPLLGSERSGLAQWEQELLAGQGAAQRPMTEEEAGARAGLATFKHMERWLTDNGFAIVHVTEE